MFNWKAVARDLVIILVLTAIGGIIIGIASGGKGFSMPALAVSNFLLGAIGFCIAGCLTQDNKWKHLTMVALLFWLSSIINVFFARNYKFDYWLTSVFFTFIIMLAGGGLSNVLMRVLRKIKT